MAADDTGDVSLTLKGVRVLLIEDEYFIADELRRVVEHAGAKVVGPANSMSARGRIDEAAFDCAVLDLNLDGENAIPLADRLLTEGRDFVIATGYGSPSIPDRLKHVPRIEKPFDPTALLKLVSQLGCARIG